MPVPLPPPVFLSRRLSAAARLSIHMSHETPAGADARTDWLPAPDGPFALIMSAYVPTQPILRPRQGLGPYFRGGSAERERERLHAGTEELDFELAIGNGVRLPD